MRPTLLILTLLAYVTSSAQKATGSKKPRMLYEVYTGSLPKDHRSQYTQLILQHQCRYCDEGTFVFKAGKDELKGEWTVLRGSATNKNATVVELTAKNKSLYFLRRKDHYLQQLDSTLNILKPAGKYLLKKQ